MSIDVGHPSLDQPAAELYRHARIDNDAERSYRCRCGNWSGVTVPAHASHVAQQLAIAGLLRGEQDAHVDTSPAPDTEPQSDEDEELCPDCTMTHGSFRDDPDWYHDAGCPRLDTLGQFGPPWLPPPWAADNPTTKEAPRRP